MKRSGVFVAALVAVVWTVAARGGGPLAGAMTAGQSLTAEEAAGRMQQVLQAVATLRARFEQFHYAMSVSEPLREKGEFFLERPDRMRWSYNDPQDKVFLYKDGVLEMYLPEDKQLTRSPVSKEALETDIFGIFLGTLPLRDVYAVEDSPFPTAAVRVRQIKLTPRTEGEFSHILLEIDEATWLPRRVIFLEWAGNKREFVFSQVRTGVRIPAKTFTLKVPPDTEVIDDTAGDKH